MGPLFFLLLMTFLLTSPGAQDPVYPGFLLKLAEDPGWTSAKSAYSSGQKARWAGALSLPELTLSSTASRLSSTASADFSALTSGTPSWPLSGGISFQIPVVDFYRGSRLALLAREQGLAEVRWEAYRRGAFEKFLMQLLEVLESDLIRKSKLQESENYWDLADLARRRQSLGAGSLRESLLAEISWKRSLAGLASAERNLGEARNALGPGALQWLLALPEDTPWLQPQGWPALLAQWGWQESLWEGSEGYRESPVYSREAEILAWNLTLLGLSEAPKLSFYSQAQVQNLPLRSSLEAGFSLSWRVLSEEGWGGSRIQAREAMESRRLALEQEKTLAERGFYSAREAYLRRTAAVKDAEEISALAEKYRGTLQTAFSAGTGTLEDVLEGWQLLSSAREEEQKARWAALKAAVGLLASSGRMILPEGDRP